MLAVRLEALAAWTCSRRVTEETLMDFSQHHGASSQQVRPHVRDEWISNSGWALLWIDGILLVPAIFGVMFLSLVPRLLVVGIVAAIAGLLGILYVSARMNPAGATGRLLEVFHVAPRPRVPR